MAGRLSSIDPADLGRSYQEVIRINSQSGKGGVAYILEQEHGLVIPRWLQIDFSGVVQSHAEKTAAEVGPETIGKLFAQHYIDQQVPYELKGYQLSRENKQEKLSAKIVFGGEEHELNGAGTGVVSAFVDALQSHSQKKIVLVEYSEHALSQSAGADAATYVQLSVDGVRYCGVGKSSDIVSASLRAILSAVNQPLRARIDPRN